MPTAPRVDAPEQAAFEVERFDFTDDGRLEVVGRWFGVRGRRFVRPVLNVDVGGNRRRLIAVLDHKPWIAADGELWVAEFPWQGAQEAAGEAELEVGSLNVDLPAPGERLTSSGLWSQPSRRPSPVAPRREETTGSRPSSPGRKPAAPPLRKDTARRAAMAGDPTSALERGLAAARSEAMRLRERYEAEAERLHAEAERAVERAESAEADLETARDEIARLQELETTIRAELDDHRVDSSLSAENDQLRAAATDARDAAAEAHAELARMTEAEAGLRADLEKARTEATTARDELKKLKRAEGSARRQLEKLRAETDGLRESAQLAEDAEARHGATLSARDEQHRTTVDALKGSLAARTAEHEAALTELRNQHTAAMAALEKDLGSRVTDVDQLNDEHAMALTALEGEHAAAIVAMKDEHAAAIADVRAEVESLRALEADYEAMRERETQAREEAETLRMSEETAAAEAAEMREREAMARKETQALRIAEAAALAELERLGSGRPAPAPHQESDTQELQRRLESEREAREQLAAQIEELRHTLQQPSAAAGATFTPTGPRAAFNTQSARMLALLGIAVVVASILAVALAGGLI